VAIFKDLPKVLLSVVYQLEMELGVLEINEEKEMAIKLK
jgi:hypothetical protein